MPYRKNFKKKNKKRTYPRRYRKKYIPRRLTLSGFPTSKMVKLRYVADGISLNAGAAITSSHVFRANSVYDPDYSTTGHQPMGFDQWALIYNKYTVVGSKITVKFTPTTTNNITPGYLGVCLGTSPTALSSYTSIDNILESKLVGTNVKTVGQLYFSNTNSDTYNFPTVKKHFSAKKFFGVKNIGDGSSYSAITSTNPAQDAYYTVWHAATAGNDPGQIYVQVMIDYITLFKEPKNLDGS